MVIVNDGSSDASSDIAADDARREERFRIVSRGNSVIVGALNDWSSACFHGRSLNGQFSPDFSGLFSPLGDR